jgi:adenosylhomocysteinase
MPVLAAIRREFGPDAPLEGQRIALCGHVTAETAVQVDTLRALGAEVVWCSSSTATTDTEVAEAVRKSGVVVHGWRGMSQGELRQCACEALRAWPHGPTLVIDEGALLITALHDKLVDVPAPMLATEKTPEGLARVADLGPLLFPIIKADESFGKDVVDNPHGTAQSLLETIATVSGRLLAGKTFVVAGYGRVGSGLAAKARGLGAQVVVTEVSATRALVAALNGYEVLPMAEAAKLGDFFCTITGRPRVIGRDHLLTMKDGAVLANGGHLPWEIDLAALRALTVSESRVAAGLERLQLSTGNTLELLGGGHTVNLSAGRGNASEVMDVTFASQVLALLFALPHAAELSSEVHPQPPACDDYVAQALASSLGIWLSD